tara:strand:+ start:461 stop:769 length:309 start_codon:yes stop_codon:yes gene_type:complete
MAKSTLVSERELQTRCEAEGIDFSQVCVCEPRWAESKPRSKNTRSALVRCDLIIRDNGSAVHLDGMMGADSIRLTESHVKGTANENNLPWDEYVQSVTSMPE